MTAAGAAAAPSGLVIVDKPADWTSHDVVGRLRRLAGTRKVGHAGTLDPMATGVLICGVGKATRLLGRIADADKEYSATIRLGISTTTDDAEGELVDVRPAGHLAQQVEQLRDHIARLTGPIRQRPSAVSAIKVNGQRAYKLVRDGVEVELPERPVQVHRFELLGLRQAVRDVDGEVVPVVDLDVEVECSTGTYIRALARDLGAGLGVGGHLTRLRRTRVGPFTADQARTLDQLGGHWELTPLPEVARQLFPTVTVDGDEVQIFGHGGKISLPDLPSGSGTIAVFDESGAVLGLAEPRQGRLAPTVVWV